MARWCLAVPVLLLLCVSSCGATSRCETLFKKVVELRENTKPGEGMGKERWEEVRDAAMRKALEWLEECTTVEGEEEHHVKAVQMIADTYSDKGDHSAALRVLERVPEANQTIEHNFVKSKILRKANKKQEAKQLLEDQILSLTTADPKDPTYTAMRHRVSSAGFDITFGSLINFDPMASMVLSELAGTAMEEGNHKAYFETLRMAVINAPFNTHLRKFVITAHGNGDLKTLWRCYSMPPGIAYDVEVFVHTLFAFSSNLPAFVLHVSKKLVSSDVPTKKGILDLVKQECEYEIPLGDDFATYRAMLEATAKCLDAAGVVADWHRISESLNVTLDEVLNTPANESQGISSAHLLAALGDHVVGVVSRNLTQAADNGVNPGHVLAAVSGAAPKLNKTALQGADEWSRKPTAPCWATRCRPDTALFGESLQAVVDSYTPSEEWGFIVPDEHASREMSKEDLMWVPRWEDRSDYDTIFDTRLTEDAAMDIDYVRPSKEVFVKKYLSVGRPVVLHDCLPDSEEIRERSERLFDFKNLVQSLGSVALPFGDKMHLHNAPGGQASLVAFALEQLRLGKRTLLQAPMRGPFKQVVDLPVVLEDVFTEKVKNGSLYTLRAGGSGSGRSMHFEDSHVVDYLAEGHRVWLLLPPTKAYYSSLPALEAFVAESLASTLGAYEVQQLPGDALYIPPGWSALFVNLRNGVGWSASFAWGASQPNHAEPPPAPEPEKPKKHSRSGSATLTVGGTADKEAEL